MKKILITLLFIIGILSISCQLETTRPKRTSSGNSNEGTNSNIESITEEFPVKDIAIDIYGDGRADANSYALDIGNGFYGTSLVLALSGTDINQYIDEFSYSIESATAVGTEENLINWFSLTSDNHTTYNNRKGPKLYLNTQIKNDIPIGGIKRTELKIKITYKTESTVVLFYQGFSRSNRN